VEAGQVEYPLATPTREDLERSLFLVPSNPSSSTELAQCAGMSRNEMNSFTQFDFGHLRDDWEGWTEMGCPDKL
jgi:hypothetical protein